MKNPIDFNDSLLDDYVTTGPSLQDSCGSWYKPSSFDQSMHIAESDDNVSVLCKTDTVLEFFQIMRNYPRLKKRVVTQMSDYSIDSHLASLRPPNITKWYAINSTHDDPAVVPIPLGLGHIYCPVTVKMHHIKTVDTKAVRSKLLYINHRPSTFPSERQPLLDMFLAREANGETWFTIGSNRKGNTEVERGGGGSDDVILSNLKEMVEHKFVLCPRGNGVDTHRLWEALYSRTVPVVRYETAHRNFRDLPILFIDNWNEVTEEFLTRKYEEMAAQKWDYSKMSAFWWKTQFR